MVEIRYFRAWHRHEVYNFCVRHNFYTCGTDEEYRAMLEDVKGGNDEPTTDVIYKVAKDILDHSGIEELGNVMTVIDMMNLLEAEVVKTCYYYG